LEQWFITIDDLLDEEDVDPFMDDDEIESVMTVLIGRRDIKESYVKCLWFDCG
jgi:hypothetical protein